MTLIAVNGQKFTAAGLDAPIAAAQTTHQPITLRVESDDYYRTLPVEYFNGPRYPHLVRIEQRPNTLTTLLQPRVK